jgi:hypothetical protein
VVAAQIPHRPHEACLGFDRDSCKAIRIIVLTGVTPVLGDFIL